MVSSERKARDKKVILGLKADADRLTEETGITHVIAFDMNHPTEAVVTTAAAVAQFPTDEVKVIYSGAQPGNA